MKFYRIFGKRFKYIWKLILDEEKDRFKKKQCWDDWITI